MAGQIRMTPETMRSRASEVQQQGNDFDDVIKKMDSTIKTLEGEWEGEASRRFGEQFSALKPSFQNMRQLVEDISRQLTQTAAAVENLDNEIASKFGI
jgi:WXG100 family type VII secretion target